MSVNRSFAIGLAVLVWISACTERDVIVDVSPDGYRFAGVISQNSTAVVNEIVKTKPTKLIIRTCRETSPSKLIMFRQELNSRRKMKLQLLVLPGPCGHSFEGLDE
ncbi:hypothetical protein [Variovorax saccharolyticus]|uniref:hypothetical protein n=1 Tax=Variovorax saccharolyticus TaxID=3053516 RepID=UPI00257558CF|nr:hypothetical protein [Variovorax sp. J31P216]